MRLIVASAIVSILAAPITVFAAVIPGEVLINPDLNFDVSGLEFKAYRAADLTAFTFDNQGLADTVDLTDTAGDVLDQVAVPAGDTSAELTVDWSLAAGQTYWLLQTTSDNAYYGGMVSGALPKNTDIGIVFSGSFGNSIADTVDNKANFAADQFWADFDDITTVASAPEPTSWTLALTGLSVLGARLRRRAGTSRRPANPCAADAA